MAEKLKIKIKNAQFYRVQVRTQTQQVYNFQFIRASNRFQINDVSCFLLFYLLVEFTWEAMKKKMHTNVKVSAVIALQKFIENKNAILLLFQVISVREVR